MIKSKVEHDLPHMNVPLIFIVWIGHEIVSVVELSELLVMNTGWH